MSHLSFKIESILFKWKHSHCYQIVFGRNLSCFVLNSQRWTHCSAAFFFFFLKKRQQAASVHSHKLVLNADKSCLCIFYYYREKACADCHGSCASASAQCHHMLDCLFWGGEMCNQIKTTYTPSLCFVFQHWVARYVHWLPHKENHSGQLGWIGGERQKSLLK